MRQGLLDAVTALDADPAIDAIWTSHPQPTRIRGLNMTRDLHLGLPACADAAWW